ncbi:MAG TPA: hypothetical protein VN643_03090 [Pyrinomonadaceae bacterium]|nr:hypothetical protein [Pyrinomonadaceae bacterium]
MTWFNKISEVPRRWRRLLAGAIVLVFLFLIYPFQSTIVPRWRVRVVDESGAQVPGISVTQHWQHYLIESDGHEEARQTDASGVVEFPARAVRASLITRLVDGILNVLTQRGTARFGPYASLVVWGSRDHETAVASYVPGTSPQPEVIVHRH